MNTCKFSFSIIVQQNISSFNVSVNFVARMKILQSEERVLQNDSTLFLVERPINDSHDISRRSSSTIFHYNPQFIFIAFHMSGTSIISDDIR
jgi:hypothetical protein